MSTTFACRRVRYIAEERKTYLINANASGNILFVSIYYSSRSMRNVVRFTIAICFALLNYTVLIPPRSDYSSGTVKDRKKGKRNWRELD